MTKRVHLAWLLLPLGLLPAPPQRALPRGPPAEMRKVHREAPARQALVPLDSPLVVQVLDRRGVPVVGALVEWVVRAGGGTVRPARVATDGWGLASARWVPGATIDVQRVVARTAGVDSVEFYCVVPIASIAPTVQALTLWVGDSATVRASYADSAGHPLAGGRIDWSWTDENVAVVSRAGGVSARGPGTTELIARAGAGRARVAITVLPVVRGTVLVPDSDRPPPSRVLVRSRRRDGTARVDSVPVAPTGDFEFRGVPLLDSAVDLTVEPTAPDARYAPVHLGPRAARELDRLRPTLMPTQWTIVGGSYAGRTVSIDPRRALARTRDGGRFWRAHEPSYGSTWLVGWPGLHRPVALALRSTAAARLAADDSLAFWAIAHRLEQDIGMVLFRPAHSADTDTTARVVISVNPALDRAGITYTTWNGRGELYDADVQFRSTVYLRTAGIATHELMHALGFGHTSAWPSVVGNTGAHPDRLTPDDAAYAQLLYALRRLCEERGADVQLDIGR